MIVAINPGSIWNLMLCLVTSQKYYISPDECDHRVQFQRTERGIKNWEKAAINLLISDAAQI